MAPNSFFDHKLLAQKFWVKIFGHCLKMRISDVLNKTFGCFMTITQMNRNDTGVPCALQGKAHKVS